MLKLRVVTKSIFKIKNIDQMKTRIYILSLFSVFLMMSCNPLQVYSDYDQEASFTKYKTFSFHENGIEKLKLNDLDKRRVIKYITAALEAKGIHFVEGKGDLSVNVLASNKEQVDVNYYNNFWWGWGWYGGFYDPFWNSNQSITRYTVGTIIIDFIDSQKNILVWQGKGTGFRVDNLENKAVLIKEAVDAIISHYPPGAEK